MNRALVFAGQGAQAVGMGKDLADALPECKSLFKKADEVLGYSLSNICFEGPIEELTKSNHCQPGIFVASVACYRALMSKMPDLKFEGSGGLSLGEWSALHVAGALSFEDTVRVLEARGRFMQEACEEREGGMVSVIGLDPEKIEPICTATGVEISNLNSPGQTVLSGDRSKIEEAAKMASDAGAKRAIVLKVAGAFHSALMASAAKRLEEFLKNVSFESPLLPVMSNATGTVHGAPDDIRRAMVRQVTDSVQWVSCMKWLVDSGVNEYIECGPGKVLTGLAKRIDKDAQSYNIQDLSTLEQTVVALS